MKNYILEACVDSVESAQAAVNGGASRLELCSGLVIGGLTPGRCLYEEVRRYCNTRIHILIRPRFGDFCYTEHEFEILFQEIQMFRKLGADGLVFGMLRPDGALDTECMERLMEAAGGVPVTLHRAFDVCRNPHEALEEAAALGISTILTSGQEDTCQKGADLLQNLKAQAGGRLTILAAGGVGAEVIPDIYNRTGIRAFHMSGKTVTESRMQYRKSSVHMGTASMSEYEIWRTEEAKIREAVAVLKRL